jgi:hypothetical protein
MRRKPPKGHPWHPWMYAERISNIQGVGRPITFNLSTVYEAPILVSMIALYATYRLTIEFTNRPYAIVSDASLPLDPKNWINDVGDTVTTKFTREYLRFCDYDFDPDAKVVQAQHGTSIFRATGGPDGKTFPGLPNMTVPQGLARYRWFGVPLRYVESPNSYLLKYQNRINQLSFLHWPVGELLYRTFKIVRRYPQPVPDENFIFGNVAFTPDKFCDLELYFEWTRRELATPPTPMPVNGNWIPAGWNLQPWYKDRKFYYTSANDTNINNQYPTHLSFPVQILFNDPDVP